MGYDAVVVGAGHNGLTCACYLAKAGPDAGTACHVHLTTPSLASVARASVECRGGELPATPLVIAWNDSVIDPSRALDGLPVRLGEPPRTRRLDGPGKERGRDDLLGSRPRLRGYGRHQGNQVVV
jgi:phytoene dehydrogenase-like protein